MKTIIVPLDFSNESFTGLNYSLMLANKTGAAVKLVYVIFRNDSTTNELIEEEIKLITMKFEEVLKNYKKKRKLSFDLSYIIKEGKIFKEITSLAETFEDSIIVLSTHGASGFEELFIGGNAYKITSHSKVPVITVRRSNLSSNLNKIVLPLDITYQTREKVSYTVKLAKQFNSEIHLLSIRLSNIKSIEKKLHQYVNQVASYINYQKVNCTIEHLQGDNLTDITIDYARSVNADLISIMTEQEKSVSNILLGSYAHQMVNKAIIPVLSFPNYQLKILTEDIWDLGAFNANS